MKKIIFIPILFSSYLFGQQAIVSSGSLSNGNGAQLSWSIGETIVETINGGGTTLTQGFQQSNIIISDVSEKVESNYSVFPNPVRDNFTIKREGENERELMSKAFLYDIEGKLIKEIQLSSVSTIVNTTDLSVGSYLLQVSTESKNKTFKIIKTN